MAQIRPEMLDRIRAIRWFHACGQPLRLALPFPAHRVVTWKQAERHLKGTAWDDTELDARNALTTYLEQQCEENIRSWNVLVRQARLFIIDEVYVRTSDFDREHDLGYEIGREIEWDLINAIMEDAYAECSPPTFFLSLLGVYESGHMPCGWIGGEWPEGGLVIF